MPQELQARRKNLRKGRTSLERRLERLTQAYLEEVIPLAEYERRRCDFKQREEALETQDRQLEVQSNKHVELAELADSIEDFCERVKGGIESATFEHKRKLVELLIDRVIGNLWRCGDTLRDSHKPRQRARPFLSFAYRLFLCPATGTGTPSDRACACSCSDLGLSRAIPISRMCRCTALRFRYARQSFPPGTSRPRSVSIHRTDTRYPVRLSGARSPPPLSTDPPAGSTGSTGSPPATPPAPRPAIRNPCGPLAPAAQPWTCSMPDFPFNHLSWVVSLPICA